MGIELKPERDDELMVEMNTTPLVDVMLVLIIMLIITIPLQTHTVVMALGDSEAPPPAAIRLELGAGGELRWDGAPLARAALEERLAGAAAIRPQPELQLRVHPRARYGAAAEVLASARRAGLERLGIEGTAP